MALPFTPAAYVIIEPESAYAHLPRAQRREALRARDRVIRKAAKMIAAGRAGLIDESEIPDDAIVFGGKP